MYAAPVALLVLVAAQGDTHAIRWKLQEGDVFYNKLTVTMDQTMEAAGMSVDQKVTMKTVLKFKVKSAKEGATVVEMTYLENKVDAQGLPGANIGEKIKDFSFTATLNDKMEVTKLEGYDKFLDSFAAGDDEKKKLLKQMMPEATIRQSLGQTFALTPDKPVAVGAKWTRSDTMAFGPLGTLDMKSSYKLDRVQDDRAAISSTSDMKFNPGEGDTALPFKVTKADLKADKFTGSYTFDLKQGRLAETRIDMVITGTMTLSVAGTTIDAKLKQKTVSMGEVTDKNPIKD